MERDWFLLAIRCRAGSPNAYCARLHETLLPGVDHRQEEDRVLQPDGERLARAAARPGARRDPAGSWSACRRLSRPRDAGVTGPRPFGVGGETARQIPVGDPHARAMAARVSFPVRQRSQQRNSRRAFHVREGAGVRDRDACARRGVEPPTVWRDALQTQTRPNRSHGSWSTTVRRTAQGSCLTSLQPSCEWVRVLSVPPEPRALLEEAPVVRSFVAGLAVARPATEGRREAGRRRVLRPRLLRSTDRGVRARSDARHRQRQRVRTRQTVSGTSCSARRRASGAQAVPIGVRCFQPSSRSSLAPAGTASTSTRRSWQAGRRGRCWIFPSGIIVRWVGARHLARLSGATRAASLTSSAIDRRTCSRACSFNLPRDPAAGAMVGGVHRRQRPACATGVGSSCPCEPRPVPATAATTPCARAREDRLWTTAGRMRDAVV